MLNERLFYYVIMASSLARKKSRTSKYTDSKLKLPHKPPISDSPFIHLPASIGDLSQNYLPLNRKGKGLYC